MPLRDVLAAGAVVFRPGGQVLLVHRPKYDDWSFPKGKLDPGEHPAAAAVREVEEETGLRVRLGVPLPGQRYEVATGTKHVSYWVARVLGRRRRQRLRRERRDRRGRLAVRYEDALVRLTYERDRRTLVEARPLRRRTHAVLVLRHAQARPRKSLVEGRPPPPAAARREPSRPRPSCRCWRRTPPSRVVTSGSTRCVDTVAAVRRARRPVPGVRRRAEPGGRHARHGGRRRGRARGRRRGRRAVHPPPRAAAGAARRSASPTRAWPPVSCWWRTYAGAPSWRPSGTAPLSALEERPPAAPLKAVRAEFM